MKKNFNSGKEIVMGTNPFYIYWIAKLFAECNTNRKLTQKDMLKNLSSKYLFWGRLSQINDVVPHYACYCFHYNLQEDCKAVLLERGTIDSAEKVEENENGFYFNFLDVYSEFNYRLREIEKLYF